jgi:hypothetical protein
MYYGGIFLEVLRATIKFISCVSWPEGQKLKREAAETEAAMLSTVPRLLSLYYNVELRKNKDTK